MAKSLASTLSLDTASDDVLLCQTQYLDSMSTTQREKEDQMPKASKGTASKVEDMGVMEGRYEELGGYTVGFETFREDADAAPLFKGLPDDRCQSPHWGCVVRGRVTFSYADHEGVYEAGDAYYAPPGFFFNDTATTE